MEQLGHLESLRGMGWPAGVRDWMEAEDRSPLLVVDSHTGGNPTRIVVGGLTPPSDVVSVPETREWLRKEADWVRTRLVHEPRGGGLTCAVLPVPAYGAGWDIGAVILEPGSYPPMCGHCMMGFGAVIAELGLLPNADSADAAFTIRAPAGVVGLRVERRGDGDRAVTLTNVESYVVTSFDWSPRPGKTARVELAFGGDYYLTVDAENLGLKLERTEARVICHMAQELREHVARRPIIDPATGDQLDVYQVMFFRRLRADQTRARVVVVAPPGVIDRSPCGTGSSALLALLVTNGEIAGSDVLTTESIIGSEFRLSVADAATGPRGGVKPTLTGRAYINGFSMIVADRHDTLRDGFPPI
jgi:proline racemase